MNAKKYLTRLKSGGNKSILLAGLLVLATIIIWCFDDIATCLYGQTSDSKGKFLSILVTVIGGFAVFYGLYLNSKRIKEQTRQNDLSDKSNNDKRFGEAIGYLNSGDIGVAIGGVYALYQLAKEDDRYVSIVGNLFSKCLFILSTKSGFDEVCNIIVNLVFKDTFKEIYLSYQNVTFQNVRIENTRNNSFNSCLFANVHFYNIEHFEFHNCTISNSEFSFISHIKFINNRINNCSIFNLGDYYLTNLDMYGNDINSLNIFSQMQIDTLCLKRNIISNDLYISASVVKNLDIDASPKLVLAFCNKENVNINGDEKQIRKKFFKDVISDSIDNIRFE